jgi:hypothetical protein
MLEGAAAQRYLPSVALLAGRVCFAVGERAVEAGVDIWPAANDEPVQGRQHS